MDSKERATYDENGTVKELSVKEYDDFLTEKFTDLFNISNLRYKRHTIKGDGTGNVKYAGYLESKYTSLVCAIDPKKHHDVYNRIIVVGSFGFHDTIVEEGTGQIYFTELSTASSSNLGTRVDILAPGENIFSTTYYADADDKAQGVKKGDKYQYMGGTSMAAPHVSGVAAMVWTANNHLTGEEVKQIICKNADTIYHYDGGDKAYPAELKYGTLNAQHAVEAALDAWHKEINGEDVIVVVLDDTEPQNGGILGYVVDSVDSKEKISSADITATDADGKEYTVQTDSEGHFELVIPKGVYTLKATKVGYIEMVLPGTYTVKAEEVITLKENIMLESVESALINAVIDNESVWKDEIDEFIYNNQKMWFQDIDFDGLNELIVGGYSGGSNHKDYYSVYRYENESVSYKVDFNGIVGDSISNVMKLCYDEKAGRNIYINTESERVTAYWYYTKFYSFDGFKKNAIVSDSIIDTDVVGEVFPDEVSKWYNGAGDEITESEYVKLYNDYFENLTEVLYTTDPIMLTDYDKLTRKEKFDRLKKSYEAFQIGEEIGRFLQIEVSASAPATTETVTEASDGVTYYPQNSEYMPTLDAWFQCYYNPSSGYDDPYIYIHPQSYIDGLKEYYPENYQLLVDLFNQTRKTMSEVQTTTPTYTVVKETVLTESECSRAASEIMNDCNRTIKDYSLYHNDISVDDAIKVYDLVVEKGYEIEIEYTTYMGEHATMTRWAVYIPNDGWKISYT